MEEIIDSPFSDGKAHLKSEKTTSVYRNEKFSYIRYYYVCDETGLEFTEDKTDFRAKTPIPDFTPFFGIQFPILRQFLE